MNFDYFFEKNKHVVSYLVRCAGCYLVTFLNWIHIVD